jgi:aminocarboxymuconate-semialdehyde decarboxylase
VSIEAEIDTVDVHAHHFSSTLDFAPDDARWPRLVLDEATHGPATGRIMLGEAVFRKVSAPLWDLSARLAELDANGVALQVISPVPIMLTYWADPKTCLAFCRAVNDSIAADVSAAGGRLAGLGTLPLQDVTLAVRELERLVGDLGLAGVQIGTQLNGLELDDQSLEPFWSAVGALGVAVFVHPLDGGGNAIRRGGQPYSFGLGMLTDTAMAATGLIDGGVLDRHPGLRVGFAHGCGTFAWAYPRLRMATQLTPNPGLIERFEELVQRLWVDTLVFDPEHLRLLVRRFGEGHVMVGTDFPFIAGQLEGARDFVEAGVAGQAISSEQGRAILAANAYEFIRITT